MDQNSEQGQEVLEDSGNDEFQNFGQNDEESYEEHNYHEDPTSQAALHLFSSSDQPLPPSKYASIEQFTEEFWKEKKQKMMEIEEKEMLNKTKGMSVPMARVKKIMRIDDDVRQLMIASDAPIFMAQAAEFFIEEMTGMGWQFVSESRRRILQKTDIASAVQQNDQFDFLIDFLPAKRKIVTAASAPAPPYVQYKEREKPAMAGATAKKPFEYALNETPRGNEYQITISTEEAQKANDF